jgi:hypothetical protein
MKNYPLTIDSWEGTRNAAVEKIKKAAKGSDNELLEDVAEERDPKKQREREVNSQAVHMLVDKCLEEYREGTYTFKKTIDQLCEALEEMK